MPQRPEAVIALPSLPLPAGARLMAFGDSFSQFNTWGMASAGPHFGNRPSGLLETAWAADPRFNFDWWYDANQPVANQFRINGANQGIGGDHLDWKSPNFADGMLNRSRYALSRQPQIVWLNAGTNSISSGDNNGEPGASTATGGASAAYVTGKLDRLIDQFTSRGVWVILSTLYPRGDWANGNPRHQVLRDVNVWIRAQSGRMGVAGVMDPYAALVSPDDPDDVRPEYFQEGTSGVHPNVVGAWVIWRDHLRPILTGAISAGSQFNQDARTANLLPEVTALMTGGANGGKGAGVSGAVPTGFSLAATRGSSTAIAAIEDAGDFKRLSMTITPINDNMSTPYHQFTLVTTPAQVPLTSTLTEGDWVQIYARVTTPDAASASVIRSAMTIRNNGTTVVAPGFAHNESSSEFTKAAPGRGAYWITSKPMRIPAAGGNQMVFTLEIYFAKAMAGAFTVKVDSLIVRRVADPRPAWNLP